MTEPTRRRVYDFSGEAAKAHIAALLAFLGALLNFVQLEGEWTWRAFGGAVLTGIVAALGVYHTSNTGGTP